MQFRALVAATVIAVGALPAVPVALAQDVDAVRAAVESRRLFAVEIKTGPGWDGTKPASEQAFFKQHSENLKRLRETGYIVMGARYSDIGLIVFSAPSADEVRRLMDRDPSMAAGTFTYAIHAMNVFYPGTVGPAPPSDD